MQLRSPLILLGAVLAGAAGMYFWQRPAPVPKADLTGLRTQLDQAAERNLPLPSLATPQIEITAAPDQLETAVANAIRLATDLGGSALRSLDRDTTKVVLVTLPKHQLPAYTAALQKQPAPASATPSSVVETETIEVLIHPSAP